MDEPKRKTVIARLVGIAVPVIYVWLSAHPDALRNVPLRATALRATMLGAQKVAYAAGRVAIEAEKAYRQVTV